MSERRNTWQKSSVRAALLESKGFVSAKQLHLYLQNQGSTISLATVYRSLGDLVEQAEADSLPSSDGELMFRACGQSHHHHLICKECGKTSEIEAKRIESWANQVAKEHGFSSPSHTIDIFGICPGCQKKVAK